MIMQKIDEVKKSSDTTASQESSADEILEFKKLMDAVIITEEEFKLKKK